MKYDVIIIGGGLGGLICARELSKAGRSVCVLERQKQPGGCMQSYSRRGRHFDTGLHYVGGLAPGQRLHRAFAHLGLMDLPWKRLDADGFDRVTIAGRTFDFAEGFDRFADSLSRHFPAERDALKSYVAMLQHVDSIPIGSQEAMHYMGLNAYDYLCDTFHDPLLVNVLAGNAMRLELRRQSLPLFTFVHATSSYIESSWRLAGDGGMLVKALADDIRAAGGDIVCGAQVVELTEGNGQMTAARITTGETYEARIFISDIHPAQTLDLVAESRLLSRLFRRRISSLQNTGGMLTVSLVLKPGSVDYFNHNKFVYREANVWEEPCCEPQIDRVMLSCRVPSGNGLLLDLLAPVSLEAFSAWADTRVGHRGAGYEQLKARLAKQCIAVAERVIPGLATMVDECYVSTPLTWRDYTLTPGGSAYGIRKDCRMPLLTILSSRTPVPNLLLTGQSLVLHGVEGVTMTALQTCSEILGKDYIQSIFTDNPE